MSKTIGPVKITSKGIETPLGVVTLTQINKGEQILNELYEIFQAGKMASSSARVQALSNDFLTAIPHNIGRARASVSSAVIDSMEAFVEKQDLLQLMRDMLNVTLGK